MKINGNDPIINAQLQTNQQEREPSPKIEQLRRPQDRLEFSTTSRELQSSEETAEARARRISEISKRIDRGTYNINAEKVAEAIITGAVLDERA